MTCDRADRIHKYVPQKHMLPNLLARMLDRRSENNNLQVFVLGGGTQHRLSKMKNIESLFVRKNKIQKGRPKCTEIFMLLCGSSYKKHN